MSDYIWKTALLWLCGMLIACAGTLQADPLKIEWDNDSQEVSAEVTGQTLIEVLGQLAAQTGWHIFVEPDSSRSITTHFDRVPIGRALEILIGQMNYALLPQTDGPFRLYVFRTSRGNATLRIEAEETSQQARIRRVGNELIVTVEPGTDIEALAKKLGATVVGKLDGHNTYRLRFENDAAADSARADLADEPGVSGVDSNYYVDRPSPSQQAPQDSMQPVQLSLKPPPEDGQIIIGLVDTAVQSLGSELDQFVLPSKSVAGAASVSSSEPSHGTIMAETILRSIEEISGGNTSIQILPVDAYGPNPDTTMFNVALALVEAVNAGADPVNLSLGSYGTSAYMDLVIHHAAEEGVQIIVAAGNEPVTDPFSPASHPDTVSVTATGADGGLAYYANRDETVDMAAPGTGVVYFNGGAFRVNGTSVAAANTSGRVAAVAESQQISTAEAAAAVVQQNSVDFSGSQ